MNHLTRALRIALQEFVQSLDTAEADLQGLFKNLMKHNKKNLLFKR